MRTGLFFGSFNPIHMGHLAIAQFFLNEAGLDRVMFVVSPLNPFKTADTLISAEKRLEMVSRSVADNPGFTVSDIEFSLEQPSYTFKTLEALGKALPGDSFSILMGSDTLLQVPAWKHPEIILSYPILVYGRTDTYTNPFKDHKNVKLFDTPLLDISATSIRKMLDQGKSIKYLVRDEIIDLLKI